MTFRKNPRISERSAYNMVLAMAYYGNHYHDIQGHIRTVSDVKEQYAINGYDFLRVIQKCRDFARTVPVFENLLGAQWVTRGVAVSRQNPSTAGFESIVSGDGLYNENNYWASFEISLEDFDSAIASGRWERFLSAVSAGLAAIEAFLNEQYIICLAAQSNDPALRLGLVDKLKTWPVHLTGRPFDLSGRSFQSMQKLKKLRDDDFQHRKTIRTGVTRKQHLMLLNEFRFAIPKLLLDLHVHFGCRCPSAIIRYAYHPETELSNKTNT